MIRIQVDPTPAPNHQHFFITSSLKIQPPKDWARNSELFAKQLRLRRIGRKGESNRWRDRERTILWSIQPQLKYLPASHRAWCWNCKDDQTLASYLKNIMDVSYLGSRLKMYKHSTGCKLKELSGFWFYFLIESCCFAQNQVKTQNQISLSVRCRCVQGLVGEQGQGRMCSAFLEGCGVPHRGSSVSGAVEERNNMTWTGNFEEPCVAGA